MISYPHVYSQRSSQSTTSKSTVSVSAGIASLRSCEMRSSRWIPQMPGIAGCRQRSGALTKRSRKNGRTNGRTPGKYGGNIIQLPSWKDIFFLSGLLNFLNIASVRWKDQKQWKGKVEKSRRMDFKRLDSDINIHQHNQSDRFFPLILFSREN